MEPSIYHEPGKHRLSPVQRTFLLASLSLLILAGALGALLLPRLLLSRAGKHPSLLNTSQTLQGDFSPLWFDEHTVLLERVEQRHLGYLWNLSNNTLSQRSHNFCALENNSVYTSTGVYTICAYGDTGTLQVVNMVTGVKTLDYHDPLAGSWWGNFKLNNDATRLVALSDREVLHIWDLQTGKLQRTLQLPYATEPPLIAWSPDEQRLAVYYRYQRLQIWDLAAGHLLYTLAGPGLADNGGIFSWSSDSTHLGFVDGTYEKTLVDIWDMNTGRLSMTDQLGVFIELSTFQLLAGGQSFFLSTGNSQFVLISAVTHRVLLSQTPSALYLSLQVSPDTKLLALGKGGSKTIEIYDGVTGQKVATYPGLAGSLGIGKQAMPLPVMLGSWSPDSLSIASAGQDGHLHVWNARTGREIASYALQIAYPARIAWSFDGSMIALVTTRGNANTPVSFSNRQETAYVVSAP